MATTNVVYAGPASDTNPRQEELPIAAGETILPGYLMVTSGSEFVAHDVEGSAGAYRIADMNVFKQQSVTTAWTAGDRCLAYVPSAGQDYNVVIADGETVVFDSPLTSNGDGTMKVATVTGATPDVVIAYAREAVTTTGSTARIPARIAAAGFAATA